MSDKQASPDLNIKQRRWGFKRISLVVILLIGLIMLLTYLFVNAYINRSLPFREGEVTLPVGEEVKVITDNEGVPHIEAQNDRDLYMAQGYVQAQSRMFQMELSRRQASGMLSELVGEAALDRDKYFRTLGLRRAAEDSHALYSDEAKEVLQWFADGVNAYIKEAKEEKSLPFEYKLLGSEPEEWTALDSLTIGKFMAFDLGGHWERQAFNYYLLNHFDEEKATELFPSYPKNHQAILRENEIDVASAFEKAVIPHEFNGSNNWVVSGDKTESGFPLLADDPHLGLATPSVWYEMHLKSDKVNVSGVIFAGVPGIILGSNETIAWGVTNTGPDVQQLYLEKGHPEEENKFLFEGEWEEARVIDEPIKVKGKETVDYQVRETRHGPVISEFAGKSNQDEVLSLKWTALEPTTELQAILEINQASDWESFEKGLESFLAPAQSFVFADKAGTIAFKANGNIPIYEDGSDALLPLLGWEKKHEWTGYIPFDELPKLINPEKGFIATANNKIADDTYPYHISNVWAQPYRYERIYEQLKANDALTLQDMKDLQMDTKNLRAGEFLPHLMKEVKQTKLSKEAKEALEILEAWDQFDESDQAAPLIFHAWLEKFDQLVYAEIPKEINDLFTSKGQTSDALLRLGDDSIWIKDRGGFASVLNQALSESIEELSDAYGSDLTAWQWGDFHQVEFTHPLSSVNGLLAAILNPQGRLAVGGSGVTAMAARDDGTGKVDHGASWRFIADLADLNRTYHIVGPGQDGHFKSDYYQSQLKDWVDGVFHETQLTKAEGKTLIIKPE